MTRTVICESVEETELFAKEFAKELKAHDFIAFFGELGSGKTAFVRGLVSALNPDETVTSPTYNIVNKYSLGEKNVYHFDMYRISGEDDLYSVGFFDYLDDGIVISEWSENIVDSLPEHYTRVEIRKDKDDENKRIISLEQI